MNLFLVTLSLFMPVCLGYVALRSLFPRLLVQTGGPALLLGYGYVIGLLLTVFLLWFSAIVLDRLSITVVLLLSSGLIGLGVWLIRYRKPPPGESRSSRPAAVKRQILTWPGALFLSLICAHLFFSLIEILTLPLFPWDAWTVWVYRAKAWFFQNQLFEFISPSDWFTDSNSPRYSHTGLNYPWVTSLIHLWMGLGLSQWHESLINLPVFLVGLAIATAVYGQLRNANVHHLLCLLAAYLVLSTPLFSIHMSLGGYADIWLAACAGLGFVALIGSTLRGCQDFRWLGFCLLLCGTLVKTEGVVWLLAGLGWWFISFAPARWVWVTLLLGVLFVLALFHVNGVDLVIPGVGRVFLNENTFFLPLLGWREVAVGDVRMAYLNSAFVLGSWNLLWAFVLLISAVAARVMAWSSVRPVLGFFAILISSQVAIFVFTTESTWANDYTAINRLPLQLLPAVVFALVLLVDGIFRATGDSNETTATCARSVQVLYFRSVVPALLISSVFAVGWLFWWGDEERSGDVLSLDAGTLKAVIGTSEIEGGEITITGYQDGIALLSSGPVNFNASQYSLLDLELTIDPDTRYPDESPAFFWRRQDSSGQVSRHTLDGRALVDLRLSREWRGTVVEVGFVFFDTQKQSPVLSEVSLRMPKLSDQLRMLPQQWFEFEPWTQRSAHYRTGGGEIQEIRLTPLVLLWMALSLLIAAWLSGRSTERWQVMGLVVMSAWLVLDVHWLSNRVRQATISVPALLNDSIHERSADPELGIYSDWLSELQQKLLESGTREIVILAEPGLEKYYGLRAKYQLLPHGTHLVRRLPSPRLFYQLDYVLFLGDFMSDQAPGEDIDTLQLRLAALPVSRGKIKRMELVDFHPQGMLFKVKKRHKNREKHNRRDKR